MLRIIGTDEAGYGPNLGALVVTATCWDYCGDLSLDEPVQRTFFEDFPKFPNAKIIWDNCQKSLSDLCSRKGLFPIEDSKKMYHSSGTPAPLERTLFLALTLAGIRTKCGDSFRSLLEQIGTVEETAFWEKGADLVFPCYLDPTKIVEIEGKYPLIEEIFKKQKLSLTGIFTRRIQPQEFNRELKRGKLKSDILADVTMDRVRMALKHGDENEESSFCSLVLCDKLGGRNDYRKLLAEHFPEMDREVIQEENPLSVYRLYSKTMVREKRMEIRFQAKGESNYPTALASIVSKYVREQSMALFNQYWCGRFPGVKPTAGYPVDAKRFFQEIRSLLSDEISDPQKIWRDR